jgi:hypothetical protein
MIQKSYIVGNQVYFVRENDTFVTGAFAGMASPTSRNSRPAASDPAWFNLCVLDNNNLDIEQKREMREVYAATPGQIRRYDAITTKRAIDYKMVAADLQPFMFELIFGTANLAYATANQNYNPLAGVEKRGWLQIEQYDQTDTLVNTTVQWVNLVAEGGTKFGDEIVRVNMTAMGLHSIYNQGTLV